MAARLPTAWLVPAALCGLAWGAAAARAKPPDLPIVEEITCAPELPQGMAAAVDDVHAQATLDTALRTATRCLLFGAHPLLALLAVDEWLADEDDDAGRAAHQVPEYIVPPADNPRYNETPAYPDNVFNKGRQQKNDFTCPYLREKTDQEQAARPPESPSPGTVSENLGKLEQAARLYRQAEFYRRTGHPDTALWYCQRVQALCPGSRYAFLAGKMAQAIQAQPAAEATGEEQESLPPGQPPEGSGPSPDDPLQSCARAEGSVARLLERCERAYGAGHFAEAEALARRAIMLDPESVAAHPLVYKLHVLTLLQDPTKGVSSYGTGLWWFSPPDPDPRIVAEHLRRYADLFKQGLYAEAQLCALQALALEPGNPTALAAVRLAAMQRLTHPPMSEPAPCPWAAEPRTTMRQPDLPPVDPTVAAALDRILIEAGKAGAEPITVRVEERGAAEEQEEPADTEVPTVFIEAPGTDPVKRAAEYLPLQDLVDALRSVTCAELDRFPECTRGRCQLSLGCLCAEPSWDRRGEHGSFTFGVGLSDPTTDLRTEQWEHDERVLRWVERHGTCDAGCPGDNETCEDPEDVGQP
jgi:tetratricopeptide (TPR) repeat protein